MEYIKLKLDFRKHPKLLVINDDYADAKAGESPNDIRVAIVNLWCYCMESSRDGSLNMSSRVIELTAGWKGRNGKLIEILTKEETRFLCNTECGCKKSTNKKDAFYMHNWLKHNPQLDPEKRKMISDQKQHAGNIRWFKQEMKILKDNGVKLKDCNWLKKGEKGRLEVIYKNLPDYMLLDNEEFFKKSHFEEANKYQSLKIQNARKDIIKKHTKKCAKCGDIHINSKSKICYECKGGKK